MSNALTYKGEEYALKGDGSSDGSVARKATAVRLYKSGSSPNKDGSGFTEVDNGNGYATGGQAITVVDWTYDQPNAKITLADKAWTAAGGTIEDIEGAFVVDGGGNVLAWWERSSALTLADGDSLTLDDLAIQLVAP